MKTQIYKRLELFWRFLLIGVGLFLVALIFFLLSVNYEEFTNQIIVYFDLGPKAEKLKTFLTPEKFKALKAGVGAILLIYCLLLLYLWRKTGKMAEAALGFLHTTGYLVSKAKLSVAILSRRNKLIAGILLIVVLAERFGFAFIYPYTYDEAFSYLVFVDKGFLVAATYYPGPNNHIFFSLLCTVVDIFFDNPVVIMRIPALLAGIACSLIVFIYFLNKRSFDSALVITSILSFSYNIFYYSIHGRGYIFVLLFFIIALFSLLQLIEKELEERKYYAILYIISSILGFYSIPIFLYPFASMQLLLLVWSMVKREKVMLRILIVTSFWVFIGTGLLYLPVVLASGWQALTGNQWVKLYNPALSYKDYLHHVGNYLWNLNGGGVTVSLLVFGAGLYSAGRKKELWGYVFLCCFLFPTMIVILQKVHPFGRVWDYLILLFSIALGLSSESLINLIKNVGVKIFFTYLLVASTVLYGFIQVREVTERKFPYYTSLNEFMKEALSEELRTVYVREENYQIFFQLHAKRKRKVIQVYTEANAIYPDLVVIPRDQPFPDFLEWNQYYPYRLNTYIKAYRKK